MFYQIKAPHFTAGVKFKFSHKRNCWECVDAAPIIKWMKNKNFDFVKGYCRQKGYEFIKVGEEV